MKHLQLQEVVSLENIDRQNNHFFRGLSAEIDRLRNTDKPLTIDSGKVISEIISKYTNIKINVIMEMHEDFSEACDNLCISLKETPNLNNVLINTWRRPSFLNIDRKVVKDLEKGITGGISLKDNKVFGDFTKIDFDLYLPILLVKDSVFTSDELASLILHEVGHAFTLLNALDQTVQTNQVLYGVFVNLVKADNPKDKAMVIKYGYDQLGIKVSDDKLQMFDGKEPDVAFNIFVSDSIYYTRSMFKNNWYIETAPEQTADQYVARLGAGLPFVTAIEKVDKTFGKNTSYAKNKKQHMEAELTRISMITNNKIKNIAQVILGGISAVSLFIGPAVLGKFLITLATGIASYCFYRSQEKTRDKLIDDYAGMASFNYEYDHPKDRIVRVRQDLVNQLKTKNKNSKYYKTILSEISGIDDVLKEYYHEDSILMKVFEIPERYDERKRQQELEALAANDLFVHAAHFKY